MSGENDSVFDEPGGSTSDSSVDLFAQGDGGSLSDVSLDEIGQSQVSLGKDDDDDDDDDELDFELADESDSDLAADAKKPQAKENPSKASQPAAKKPAPKKPSKPAGIDLGAVFDLSVQMASTARQHVEAAYKDVSDPNDAGQRKQARARLRVSLLKFCEQALESKHLDENGVADLFRMSATFANTLLLTRGEQASK